MNIFIALRCNHSIIKTPKQLDYREPKFKDSFFCPECKESKRALYFAGTRDKPTEKEEST